VTKSVESNFRNITVNYFRSLRARTNFLCASSDFVFRCMCWNIKYHIFEKHIELLRYAKFPRQICTLYKHRPFPPKRTGMSYWIEQPRKIGISIACGVWWMNNKIINHFIIEFHSIPLYWRMIHVWACVCEWCVRSLTLTNRDKQTKAWSVSDTTHTFNINIIEITRLPQPSYSIVTTARAHCRVYRLGMVVKARNKILFWKSMVYWKSS
jgi:hypothetical protein